MLSTEPPLPEEEVFASLMPMSSPAMFSRAPPELPGLMAASVWMSPVEVIAVPLSSVRDRSRLRALTTPVVTDWP